VRVLFWGTSTFAVPSLRALVGEGFDVVGAVTQPDRPVRRSRSTVVAPPVKETAAAEQIPVLQPERPRGAPFLASIAALEPEISVVVSYGHLLPRAAIELPPLGTINVHASLLPKLRGAAPIQAAVRDGYIETGISIVRMVSELDAGPIILQARTPIASDETYGELELRLSELGALALVEALTLLSMNQASAREQDHAAATYAGKIDRSMARIPWREGCGVVGRLIRAYDPKPGAYTHLRDVQVKLFGARETEAVGDEGPRRAGEIVGLDEYGLVVACGDGAVSIAYAQPEARRRMTTREWITGRTVSIGDVLS
jgi:methionyl-tRNA formyltransferase